MAALKTVKIIYPPDRSDHWSRRLRYECEQSHLHYSEWQAETCPTGPTRGSSRLELDSPTYGPIR